jgi:hypothetical protein
LAGKGPFLRSHDLQVKRRLSEFVDDHISRVGRATNRGANEKRPLRKAQWPSGASPPGAHRISRFAESRRTRKPLPWQRGHSAEVQAPHVVAGQGEQWLSWHNHNAACNDPTSVLTAASG